MVYRLWSIDNVGAIVGAVWLPTKVEQMQRVAQYVRQEDKAVKMRRATVFSPAACASILDVCRRTPVVKECYLLDICNPANVDEMVAQIVLNLRREHHLESVAMKFLAAMESFRPFPVPYYVGSVTGFSHVPPHAAFYRRPSLLARLFGATGLLSDWEVAGAGSSG